MTVNTADDSANSGSDYVAIVNQLVTFNPGETIKTVSVTINGDTTPESNETFFVNLSHPTHAVISDAQGVGTIINDDIAPTLSIDDVAVVEGNSDTTAATFTLTLSTSIGIPVSVTVDTADGTAIAGSDYVAVAGRLVTFDPGETSETVTVLVNGDTAFEPNETFYVNLSGSINAIMADAQGLGIIKNDDAAPHTPGVTNAVTLEDTQTTGGLVVSRAMGDENEVTDFKVTSITGGTLYENDGTTPIVNGEFVAFTEGLKGLKFTPTSDANSSTATFGFKVQASFSASDAGLVGSVVMASITVTPVNDAPSFTASSPSSNEDAGGISISHWATFNPGGGEDTQIATFLLSNLTNASLFTSLPAVDADGNLTYTTAPNSFGTATFDMIVQDNGGTSNGGVDTSSAQSFTITVHSVNDQPSFNAWSPPPVNEDVGTVTIPGWATFNTGGGDDEASQTATYHVAMRTNPDLFVILPSISPDGTLTYTPAPNASGVATFSLTVQDSGGTDNGGVDTSGLHLITVTVAAVNDAPFFQKGPDVITGANSAAFQQSNWATLISAGPANESSQHLTFVLSGYDTSLFTRQPAIDASGQLSFILASDNLFATTVTVTLHDDGGTDNGGVDSFVQTFAIVRAIQFGAVGGKNIKITVPDSDGTNATFSLTGKGTGTLTPNTQGGLDLAVAGADAKSTLSIATDKGGDGAFALSSIAVDDSAEHESLDKIDAKTTSLHGDLFVTGVIDSIALNNVGPGTFSLAQSSTTPMSISLGRVTDLSINASKPIKSLLVTDWNDSDGISDAITTPWIGSITAKPGGFQAGLNLSGVGAPKGVALGKFSVGGSVTGSEWNITGAIGAVTVDGAFTSSQMHASGNIGAIMLGAIVDSTIFAGVGEGVTALPAAFANPSATIASLTVKGLTSFPSFARSLVAAGVLTKVSLKVVDPANGTGTFGFAADKVKSYRRSGLVKALSNLDSPNANNDPGLGGDYVLRTV